MSDREPSIPADVIRQIADEFERDAGSNESGAEAAEDPEMVGHFNGKADAYRRAAKRLNEYCDTAER